MRRALFVAIPMLLLCMGSFMQASAETATKKTKEKKALKVGDVAPEFQLKGSDGKTYKLSDFKEKAGVGVAWYPKALTGG